MTLDEILIRYFWSPNTYNHLFNSTEYLPLYKPESNKGWVLYAKVYDNSVMYEYSTEHPDSKVWATYRFITLESAWKSFIGNVLCR